jgi:aminodeoxyfutalosine deaminase
MRKISANYLFPVSSKPLKNGIVEVADDGTIVRLIDTGGELIEQAGIEFYNGVIVPGFVNCHCHIELSYLKDQMPKGTGLPNFIENIISFRKSEGEVEKEIIRADKEMEVNGIKAIGDISNLPKSFATKAKSKLIYHTFLEAFSITGKEDNDIVDACLSNYDLLKQCKKVENITKKLTASIVPHAPYSVSENMFGIIENLEENDAQPISIHNQETPSENELFLAKKGSLYESLTKVGIDMNGIARSQKSSLAAVIDKLAKDNNKLLVHNTFTQKDDIEIANAVTRNLFWVLCPNANLYIENLLPDVNLFLNENQVVCLGTDSYASNTSYSILSEMQTISKHFPNIRFEHLIGWATLNGAKALQMDKLIGSIEQGKKPGLNLISHFDFRKMNITKDSLLKVLI